MTTPSAPDGRGDPAGESSGDAPFLPPARPVTSPASGPATEPAPNPPPPGSAPPEPTPTEPEPAPESVATETPFLPSATPPAPAAPAAESTFDAKAMVEAQKHFEANPAYGPLPAGSEEGRAAARKLREAANRKKRRARVVARLVGLLVLAGLAVGGYFAYQAFQDEQEDDPLDEQEIDPAAGEDGALTPLGEQEQVLEALDDVNSGARPSAGGLLDAVDEARDAVGQAEPPTATPDSLLVADVFTPAVLDHTDVLENADGHERFVVRTEDLVAINPSAHEALVERLLALPQVAGDDPQLAVAPVVLPGDIAVAIQRDGDRITRIVAVAAEPEIHAVGP